MNKTHSNKQPYTTPKRTSEMVESAWTSMGYILHNLEPGITRMSSIEDFEKGTICGLPKYTICMYVCMCQIRVLLESIYFK